MRNWYFVPPPGFTGFLNQWIVTLQGEPTTLRQVPQIVVKQEPIRVRLPREVTRLAAYVASTIDGNEQRTIVEFTQENPYA